MNPSVDLTSFENIAAVLCERDLLFSTPFNVSAELQKQLIEYIKHDGSEMPAEVPMMAPFWRGFGLTEVKHNERMAQVSPDDLGYWQYYSRLDPSLEWAWTNHPAVDIVKEILAPIAPFFTSFSRVTLINQIPGQAIPAHRDLVVGDTYDNMINSHLTILGKNRHTFVGHKWFQPNPDVVGRGIHSRQRYLTLKIPLSETAPMPGKPFITFNGQKIFYSSRGNLFFLNEALVEHGADPFHLLRGVVFVDGFLNMDRFAEIPRQKIEILATEPFL